MPPTLRKRPECLVCAALTPILAPLRTGPEHTAPTAMHHQPLAALLGSADE